MTGDLPMGGYKITNVAAGVSASDGVTKAQLDAVLAQINSARVPSGVMLYYAAGSTPAGWLRCNGAAVSRSTYADLFAAIGTTYGVGDGSTTFNLPNPRGKFIRVLDEGAGIDPSRALGSYQADEIKSHTHSATSSVTDSGHSHNIPADVRDGANGGGSFAQANEIVNGAATSVALTGISVTTVVSPTGGAETRPKNDAFPMIIKI
jgi:microcystin-dependent protein